MGTRTSLTPELHQQFTGIHPVKAERKGMWVFPAEIIGSTKWLAGLWEQRDVLRRFDITLLWGMNDIAFRSDILDR